MKKEPKVNREHKRVLRDCAQTGTLIHLLFNRNGYIEHKDQPAEAIPRFFHTHAERYTEMGILENVRGNYYKVLNHHAIKQKRTDQRQKDISNSPAYFDIVAKLERAGYDHSELKSTQDFLNILPKTVNGGALFIDVIPRRSGSYNYKSGYEGERRSIHTMGSKVRAVERLIEWLIYNRIDLKLPKTASNGND